VGLSGKRGDGGPWRKEKEFPSEERKGVNLAPGENQKGRKRKGEGRERSLLPQEGEKRNSLPAAGRGKSSSLSREKKKGKDVILLEQRKRVVGRKGEISFSPKRRRGESDLVRSSMNRGEKIWFARRGGEGVLRGVHLYAAEG